MANLITLSRLVLLIGVVLIAYLEPSPVQFIGAALLVVVFVTDGLDGWVARARGETSTFGAVFDIAADRIVELSMWLVLLDLGIVDVWIPLVFIIRGAVVDAIRTHQTIRSGDSPFASMRTPLGRWLVAGRFMRGLYAVMKAVTFCWLLLMLPMPAVTPDFWAQWQGAMQAAATTLIWASVALCLARGLPVIAEFVIEARRPALPQVTGPVVTP
jgi:CDP-diacylglycerol---glycerol-3-phosphate 3-phosphatidyltransferase